MRAAFPPPPVLIKKLCCSPSTAARRVVSPSCPTRPPSQDKRPRASTLSLCSLVLGHCAAFSHPRGREAVKTPVRGQADWTFAGYEGGRQALNPPHSSLPPPSHPAGPRVILIALRFAKHVHVVTHLKPPSSVKEPKLEFCRGSEADPRVQSSWTPNTVLPLPALLPLVSVPSIQLSGCLLASLCLGTARGRLGTLQDERPWPEIGCKR